MIIFALALTLGIAFSIFQFLGKASAVANINGPEARNLIGQGTKVIDVRTPDEYGTGHIPGAISAPLDQLPKLADNFNKDEPLIVVCLSGNRSTRASEYLLSQGFAKIYNLSGGMLAWKGPVTN